MDPSRVAAALLASPADAILAVDRAGTIRLWNPGAVRIFGFTAAEAVGAPLDIVIPENLRPRHRQGFDRVVMTGETRYGAGDLLAVPALTRDGRRISVEFTIVLLRDDTGAVTGMAATLRDVTARFDEVRALRRRVAGEPA